MYKCITLYISLHRCIDPFLVGVDNKASSASTTTSKRPLTSADDRTTKGDEDDDDEDDFAGDGVSLADPNGNIGGASGSAGGIHVARWRTRVFAIQSLRKAVAQKFTEHDIVGWCCVATTAH